MSGKNERTLSISPAVILTVAGIALLVVLVVFGVAYFLLSSVSHRMAAAIGALLVIAMPVAFSLGYAFGRFEMRGFLRGADMTADRFVDKLTQAVAVREQSAIRMYNARQQPPAAPNQVAVILPGIDQMMDGRRITESPTDGERLIDL